MTLSVLLKARGYDAVCFITDSVYHSHQPGETVSYSGRHCELIDIKKIIIFAFFSPSIVVVSEDCKTMVVKGTNILAGSCSNMLDIFHNLVRIMNVPIAEAVKMLSENPARYECKKYAHMETIVCIVYSRFNHSEGSYNFITGLHG